ncbi:MAG: response regulator [Microcystaceae cyanobacterium]
MSSYHSNPRFSVDSFDNSDLDDIAQLFDAFEQDEPEPDPNLAKWVNGGQTENEGENRENKKYQDEFDDDLADLFDEASPTPSYQSKESDQGTFSSLPSDEELANLFGEFGLDSPDPPSIAPQIPPTPPEPDDNDQELLNLFEDDQIEVDILAEPPSTASEDRFDVLDDLKSLLSDDFGDEVEEPPVPVVTPQASAKQLPDSSPVLYQVIEELGSFIQKSAHPEPIPDFAALEALIDAPASLEQPEIVSEVATPAIQQGKDKAWDDMEELASAMGHKIGSGVSSGSTSGSSVKANRPSKLKGFEETVRVSVKQLDNLSNLIGELVVKRNRLEQDQERLGQFLDNLLNHVQSLSDVGGRMQDLYERTLLEGALLATRSRERNIPDPNASLTATQDGGNITQSSPAEDNQDLDALEMDRFTGFHLLSQEMIELIVRVREATSDIQFLVDETEQVGRSLRQSTTQLQEGMTKTRMVPFGPSADRLVRPVRDISRQLKKQARLNVEGKDVLIDKMILEHLSSPLTHLVNNAVTHGIESPDIRQKGGKSPEGQINVRSFLQGNQTVISFADDGGGIDPEKIKRKAIEKNLVSKEDALALNNSEIYDFLFHPGFSTKEQADQFAGRGVGLDVVRTSLNDIRGSVTIDSEIGKGTTFTIRLPLTLSICKALCCLSNHARIAFPMDGVEDMKDYAMADLPTNEQDKPCIRWGQSLLPIYSLSDLLTYNRQLSRGNIYGGKPSDDTISIVILRGAGSYLAIQVDQVVGEQEIVIKQIEGPAPKPPGIAGATVLGDGTIMPIGDVLELIEIAKGRIRTDGSGSLWRTSQLSSSRTLTSTGESKRQSEPTVLIVDDSLTVRQYLSHSFGKAGYRVEQARDGQEAWEQLRSGLPCDIVFCDIEMPRMNGLELLSSLQKDEHLCEIPIALLTSRGADRHRKVAAKLGASGYYIKPAPDAELLEAAERMINGEVLLAGSVRQPRVVYQEDEGGNGEATTTQPENHLVLIVDDSVMVREMLSETFLGAGYQVEQARDGQDALEKLRNGLSCDLILCDIEMPKMNGLELLSRLQSDEGLSEIPMAMITSRGAQKMKEIAAERGAKGYFVKPYIEEEILDSAKRLIAGEVMLEADSLSEV